MKYFKTYYRVVDYRDIVPHVPSCTGDPCKQQKDAAYHQTMEIWYGKDMAHNDWQVCDGAPLGEDQSKKGQCANGIIDKKPCIDIWNCVEYHRYYWNLELGYYG